MRGRPKNAQPEITAKSILDASTELFATRGFHGTSFRTIAKSSGLSIGTIQHHFGTKDRLYSACIHTMYDELEAIVEGFLPKSNEEPCVFLERAVQHGFEFSTQHRTALRLVSRAILEDGGLPESLRSKHNGPLLVMGSNIIAQVTGGDLERVSLGLQSAVLLIVRYALASDDELKEFTFASQKDPIDVIKSHLMDVIPTMILGPT